MIKINNPKARAAVAIEQFQGGNAEYLIRYLRSSGDLTPEIRNFIADVLEGKIKRKRGPKNQPKAGYYIAAIAPRMLQEMKIKERYSTYKCIADMIEETASHAAAVEATAKELGITESAVDKVIYPRMRTASRKFRGK